MATKTNLQFDAVWSVCISFFWVGVWSIISFTVIIYYMNYMLYIWVSILVPMCAGTGGSWWMFNFAALWHAKHVLSSCIFKSAGKLFPRIMLESLSKWRP
jgi:hypothetical protein